MSRFALPFLTLTPNAVDAGKWSIDDGEGPRDASEKTLSHWDYALDLKVTRSIRVDFAAAAEDLKLPQESLKLGVRVRAGTGQGLLPRIVSNPLTVDLSLGKETACFETVLPGRRLANRLHLETSIYLASRSTGHPLSPQLVGSRLWSDVLDLPLESEEQLFPVEAVSFSKQFAGRPEEGALWYLHWSSSALRTELSSGMRLYLNSDRQEFMQRMLDQDATTIQMVASAVIGQAILSVLQQGGVEELFGSFDEGSLGHQIINWMKIAFPGQSPSEIREIAENQPSMFYAAVQAIADLGEASE